MARSRETWERTMKVTVVGSGFVGATTAMRVAQKGVADEVVMIDIVEGLPQGLALDMNQSSPVEGFEPVVRGTNEYEDTSGSEVVVITAGLPRQPGMSRMDLLDKNAGIMRDVAVQVKETSPRAVVIVVSNPLDEMTFLASEVTGFPRERVIGMAGTLDSARLRYFIAEELGVSPSKVEAMTLGSHGESMVPLPGHASVDGKPLKELVDDETLKRLYERTSNAGAEIVGFLKKGSAYYAPSASVAQMVNAVVGDTKAVVPACVWASGQYGISDVFVGLPARLGRGGVEEIVELDLGEDVLASLREAAEGIRSRCRDLGKLE
jgi:malate dehydrogenase